MKEYQVIISKKKGYNKEESYKPTAKNGSVQVLNGIIETYEKQQMCKRTKSNERK